MRIMMLSQFFPPLLGGEERMVAEFAEQMVERGHDVSVVTLASEDLPAFEMYHGARVYRVNASVQKLRFLFKDQQKRQAPPIPDPQLTWEIQKIIRRERPEIVHAHNWIVHSFLPLKRWSRAKLVMSLHDFSFVCPTKKLVHNGTLDRLCSGPGMLKCLRCSAQHYGTPKAIVTTTANRIMSIFERNLVDLFLPVSTATAIGNQLDARELPYRVLPNFLKFERAPLNDEVMSFVEQLPDEPFLMYAGAFASYKGVDTLLDAYRQLRNAPPLVLVGYRTAEYPMTAENLPANVTVHYDWPHHAVMEAWHRSLIGIVPSRVAETFGIVALEAMIAGKPVIASRIGGLPDVISDGETGLLFDPGDSTMLRDQLQKLLDSPDMRSRMGVAGQRRAVDCFSSETVIAELESIYMHLHSQTHQGSTSPQAEIA